MSPVAKRFMYTIFTIIFLFIIIIAILLPLNLRKGREELVFVSGIFRHGNRLTTSYYPTDPNKNQTIFPFKLGELTEKGKKRMYSLGKYLRNVYGDLISETYSEEEFEMVSVQINRTLMSAQFVLAALYPPSEKDYLEDGIEFTPIPIYFTTRKKEMLFHRTNCPYKWSVLKKINNWEVVKGEYMDPYASLYKFVSKKTGKKISTPIGLLSLYLILRCEEDMGYTLPEWTSSVYPDKLIEAGSKTYSYMNYNTEMKRINSGYLLSKILYDCSMVINGVRKKKMMLYSGQESTIGYMLNNLKIFHPHIPDYGSLLVFELWKRQNKYYIKIKYRYKPESGEMLQLTIPDCEFACPFARFRQLTKEIIPLLPIDMACSETF